MRTTLKELLHAINILGEDRDVLVDGIDSIAVCPPVRLTPAGRSYWHNALHATVVVDHDRGCSYVSDANMAVDEQAFDLLSALAGYCGSASFERWFEGDDAEII